MIHGKFLILTFIEYLLYSRDYINLFKNNFLSCSKLGPDIYLYKILYAEVDIKDDNIS